MSDEQKLGNYDLSKIEEKKVFIGWSLQRNILHKFERKDINSC